MLPEWITPVALLGLVTIAWAEIRSLRMSRHEYNNRLAAVETTASTTSTEVTEIKEIVGDMRDSLIAAGVMKPKRS